MNQKKNFKEQVMLPQIRRQRGFSLAEVMMATALVGVLVYATVTITSTGVQLTKSNMDKQFATQKAKLLE